MVNVKKVVKSIIKGKIKEKELFSLAKEQSLLILYEGKTILDYILEYKRNLLYTM